MSTKSQKRALPPTPTKYSNTIQSLLAIEGLSEREEKMYHDYQKTIEQKDSAIKSLKAIILEWKKKATEYETAYKDVVQKSEEREQFLIKQHKAEIEAMTQVQVNQTNEHLDMMIQLENENQLLRQPEQPLSNSHFPHQGTTIQLCHTAEMANKAALQTVSSSKQNSEELIQRINDMVNDMEDTLYDFKNNTTVYMEDEPPALSSDSSSCGSSISSSSDDEQQQQQQMMPKKKRSATIPNFLFSRNKNKDQVKRNASLNEPSVQLRKPLRALSILSTS